ncbi:MAG: DUF5706 domain-containing protein [Brachymonas sp.]|nr:DUF5706 domain-containing protein [Brachymonas sp.]
MQLKELVHEEKGLVTALGGAADGFGEAVHADGGVCEADEAAAGAETAEKKKGKKKKAVRNEGKPSASLEQQAVELGTAKGVETMFRNAFRTEMELLALAATKANIMISLNGFIVSALMISGAFIFSDAPEFLVPAGIFMFTAASSIVFALLSASPERAGKIRGAWHWLQDLFKGKASFSDFKTRVTAPGARFVDQTPNILIYEDRVKIPKDEYWEMMQATMADRKKVYHSMSDELYWLGKLANKQFKYLDFSYTVFRWGLLASVLAFIGIKTLPGIMPSMQERKQSAELAKQGVHNLKGIYEPSALQSLPDGRVLVAEDEHSHAFSIISFDKDGNMLEDEAVDTRIIRGFKRKISDLEGLALDDEGYVYAVTSHARTREGLRRPEREHLMRFKIQNNDVRELASFDNLTDVLENSEQLHAMLTAKVGVKVDFSTINIEGLAFDPNTKRLLLGFRKPEFNQKAIVAYIGNPKEIFTRKAEPEFVDVAVFDIKGGGIRSLNYDPVLKTFIMSNEVKDEEGNKTSQLWTWSGAPDAQPKAVDVPSLRHLTNVEAIDSVVINGQPRILMMSDEGDAKLKKPGKYTLVDHDEM